MAVPAKSNRMLLIIGVVVALMAVFVMFKSGSDAPAAMTAVPDTPSADADTAADTIRTLTAEVKNVKKKGRNYPLAWDLAERLQERLILLPESFWLQDDISIAPYGYFNTFVSNTFHHYCLSFQKPNAAKLQVKRET